MRVDISIAILQMELEFNWNQQTKGLVQSSFFWGYICSQLPAGYCADRFGGKQVLFGGMAVTGVMALLTPVAASTGLGALFAVRTFLGAGQGCLLPASTFSIPRGPFDVCNL